MSWFFFNFFFFGLQTGDREQASDFTVPSQACTSRTAPGLLILYVLAPAHRPAGTKLQCEPGRRGEGGREGRPLQGRAWAVGLSEDSACRRDQPFGESSGTKKPLLQKSLLRFTLGTQRARTGPPGGHGPSEDPAPRPGTPARAGGGVVAGQGTG